MKKFLHISVLTLLAATCAPMASAEVKVLNLNAASPAITYDEKGVWTDCYNPDAITIDTDIFTLTHSAETLYQSYAGFCPSKVGDNKDYSTSGTDGASEWVANQWGCMAGGGIKVDADGNVVTDEDGKVVVDNTAPYLVCYWSYYNELMSDEDDDYSLQILLSTEDAMQAKEIYICNAPWGYYNVMKGDSYATAFSKADDKFTLTIHAIDEDFNYDDTNTIDVVLGNTTDNGNGSYVASAPTDWQKIDLSSLGKVRGVYFTMASTDTSYGWMNTASYFCADRFTVGDEDSTTGVTSIVETAEATPIYYNLNGTRVNACTLTPGVYVKVVGNKATKVCIR